MRSTQKQKGLRFFAVLLCACMLAAALPAAAFAEDGELGGTQDTPPEEQSEALFVDKRVKENEDGFTLTLESYATGSNASVEVKQTPVDIVLVLDESGSMKDKLIEGCGNTKGEDVTVTAEGHLAADGTASDPEKVLFVGHRVMKAALDTSKSYTIVYPANGTTREVTYCPQCEKWYSDSRHDKHNGKDLAEWIPFENADETPTNNIYIEGSQNWNCHVQFYERCGTTGKEVLQGALRQFLNSLYTASNPEDGSPNVQNRVAIVGYGEGASYIYKDGSRYQVFPSYNNTPQQNYDPAEEAGSKAEEAFYDVTTLAPTDLDAWVNGVQDTGATPTILGIQAAKLAFEHTPVSHDDVQRKKVMILFTDGAPGSGYVNYGPGSMLGNPDWVTPSISMAKEMKDAGVTIYCVGLFEKADGYNATDITYDVTRDGKGTEGFFQNANCFLHLVSSNYPKATGVDEAQWGALSDDFVGNGTLDPTQRNSYYLGTDDGEHLSDIFTHLFTILNPGATTVTLKENAVVKDTISSTFQISNDGQMANVRAYTMSYGGVDADGKEIWTKDEESASTPADYTTEGKLHITVSGRDVSVTNFNFADNYVHMQEQPVLDEDGNPKTDDDDKPIIKTVPAGKKLVIEIDIKPVDGSAGGERLGTNTGKPGVYGPENPNTPVKEFPLPHVDLPTTVTVKKEVKNIETDQPFTFTVNYKGDTQYENLDAETDASHSETDSNYLHLTSGEKSQTLTLANGQQGTIEKVAPGTELTIQEVLGAEAEKWYVTVTSGGQTMVLTQDDSGNFTHTVTVTPGMVITFTNMAYSVVLEKVDPQGKRLPGAKFQLERLKDAAGAEEQWDKVGDVQTSDANGLITWNGLAPGTYHVVETEAPGGYLKLNTPYEFVINAAQKPDDTTVKIRVRNGKAPETGGRSAMLCRMAGLALLTGAAALAFARKKRRG